MSPRQIARAEARRRRGFTFHVLVCGVLGWSTLTIATTEAIRWLFTPEIRGIVELIGWPRTILIWFGAGFLFGVWSWVDGEWRYRRHLRNHHP